MSSWRFLSVAAYFCKHHLIHNFYHVMIEAFDNEVYSYEVEARNDEEATEKAEQLFSGNSNILSDVKVRFSHFLKEVCSS